MGKNSTSFKQVKRVVLGTCGTTANKSCNNQVMYGSVSLCHHHSYSYSHSY